MLFNIIRDYILDGHEKHTDLNYRTIASLAGNLFAGCSACSCVAVQYLKDLRALQNHRLVKPHAAILTGEALKKASLIRFGACRIKVVFDHLIESTIL